MKKPNSIKDWPAIKKGVIQSLKEGWQRSVYVDQGKTAAKLKRYRGRRFIVEVSFTKEINAGLAGSTYGCDQCTQALLRRIASL
jgi:hypothetical protein